MMYSDRFIMIGKLNQSSIWDYFSIRIMILIVIVLPVTVWPQTNEPFAGSLNDSVKLSPDEIKIDIEAGLNYLKDSQQKETFGFEYYEGEWPIYICLKRPLKLKGKSRFYDSNSFGVIPIHNSLAEIFLLYPEYRSILPMLEKSMSHILSFMTDSSETFGFWKSLPPGKPLSGKMLDSNSFIKRPNHFPLRTKFTNNFVNVMDDSDDQALALNSILYYKKVMEKAGFIDQFFYFPDSVQFIFEKYRDVDRKNILLYNLKQGYRHNTGAFLTWFGKEYEFNRTTGFSYFVNNIFWYLPISRLRSEGYEPHIPFATNDIDVVVNANILTTLAHFNLLDSTKGVDDAMELIIRKVKEGNFRKSSLYYPNRYQLHYAVSRIYSACNRSIIDLPVAEIINDIKATQRADGSWSGLRKPNRAEVNQSTVNALLALLNFGNYEEYSTLENIDKGIFFLHSQAIQQNGSIHWEGGVFFCGGMYIRNLVAWKSDCNTTALIIEAFAKYRLILERNNLNCWVESEIIPTTNN